MRGRRVVGHRREGVGEGHRARAEAELEERRRRGARAAERRGAARRQPRKHDEARQEACRAVKGTSERETAQMRGAPPGVWSFLIVSMYQSGLTNLLQC